MDVKVGFLLTNCLSRPAYVPARSRPTNVTSQFIKMAVTTVAATAPVAGTTARQSSRSARPAQAARLAGSLRAPRSSIAGSKLSTASRRSAGTCSAASRGRSAAAVRASATPAIYQECYAACSEMVKKANCAPIIVRLAW
jgi:hypothetical protein